MIGGKIYLHKGWRDVVPNFSIDLGDIIFFKYDDNSKLSFTIAKRRGGMITAARRAEKYLVVPIEVNEQTRWTSRISIFAASGRQPLAGDHWGYGPRWTNAIMETDLEC